MSGFDLIADSLRRSRALKTWHKRPLAVWGVGEVDLEVRRALAPCHAIDTRGGALLQAEEGRPQDIDGDAMQERCEFLLLAPDDSSTFAILRLCHGFRP